MRIQYMSDLHMELWDNSRYIRANEFEVVGDVLVLAGARHHRTTKEVLELGLEELPSGADGARQS